MATARLLLLLALVGGAFCTAVCSVASCDAAMAALASDFTCDSDEGCRTGVVSQVRQ